MLTNFDSKNAICPADKPPRKAGAFCDGEAQSATIVLALK